MIVCLCRGVPESAVDAVIASGASSVSEVARQCGAGTDCRACCAMIEALLERARERLYSGAGSPR
jgi:bacterioferritin-associated ferredoxin